MHDDRLPFGEIGSFEISMLYEWTFEDAAAAQDKWNSENSVGSRGPLFQWIAAQRLEELRLDFEAGNTEAILEAIFECSMDGLPLPAWCSQAYINAYREVKHYSKRSWDDVFGSPHTKGANLAAKKKRRLFEVVVYQRIKNITEKTPDIPIDENLFEKVGRELGIGGKTTVSDYYYNWKNKMEKLKTSMKTNK